jgi:hypothetical protein
MFAECLPDVCRMFQGETTAIPRQMTANDGKMTGCCSYLYENHGIEVESHEWGICNIINNQ